MSEYNACQLSKLPKEILIKMLLAKDNTEHFDLFYCYGMKDKISSRIEKLKTEEIKRKLIEQIKSGEKEILCFISKITRIRFSENDDLEFEYSLQKFHQIICSKNGIYTVFENIGWFLDNDKLELNLKGN